MTSNITGLIIVGLVFVIWGITGALSGNISVSSTNKYRQFDKRPPTVIYQGSALGIVFAVTGGILALLGVAARLNKPLLAPELALKYALYVGIGGAVISVIMVIVNQFTNSGAQNPDSSGYSAPMQGINHPMSLHDAAKYLKIPEDELLNMAENGGIRAHHINGKYVFDGEILQDLRDVLHR